MAVRRSEVQKQTLALYKSLLTASRDKPGAKAYIQAEFRKNKSIPKTNFMMIEYLLRWGRKQLQLLENGQITSIQSFSATSRTTTSEAEDGKT